MGFLDYFKKRLKPMLLGFLVGIPGGYFRAWYFEPPELGESGRWILTLQIAFAFSVLGLFIANYLDLRQKVFQRVAQEEQKRSEQKAEE